jgi:hypothetical protein
MVLPTQGFKLMKSYEHHSLEEPAVDCWNVTDGMNGTVLRLICRKGNWTGYFETFSTHLLNSSLSQNDISFE